MTSFAQRLERTMNDCATLGRLATTLRCEPDRTRLLTKTRYNLFFEQLYTPIVSTSRCNMPNETIYIPFFDPETTKLRNITERNRRFHSLSEPCAAIMANSLLSTHTLCLAVLLQKAVDIERQVASLEPLCEYKICFPSTVSLPFIGETRSAWCCHVEQLWLPLEESRQYTSTHTSRHTRTHTKNVTVYESYKTNILNHIVCSTHCFVSLI